MSEHPATIGPYRIVEPLGSGGMGVVYRARPRQRGREVALKTVRIPDAALLNGIRREILALARLRHPGVVRIVDEGVDHGLPWYAMELVDGVTLGEWIRRIHSGTDSARSGSAPMGSFNSPFATLPTDTIDPATDEVSADGPASFEPRAARRMDATRFVAAVDPRQAVSPSSEPTYRSDRIVRLDVESAAEPDDAADSPGRSPAAGGSLGDVLTMAWRLCHTLAFLHGEGIVHRDLKPSNILIPRSRALTSAMHESNMRAALAPGVDLPEPWLVARSQPVLVDFGLMVRSTGQFGRETLELSGARLGTVAYMAPEQIRGELVDARADLYSLGCILFELVTGRRPFRRASIHQLLQAHLEATPPTPSQLVDGVPPELDSLISRLLAKRPRERPGHADDVAAALSRLGAGVEAGSLGSRDRHPGQKSRAYLYRPGFAGREHEFLKLEHILSSAASGGGRVAVLGGESGSGKTRLLIEFARWAGRTSASVYSGESVAPEQSGSVVLGGGPLHPLRRALQQIGDQCREQGLDATERILGPRGRLLAMYEPSLSSLPGQQQYADPAELPAASGWLRLFGFLTDTFAALAEAPPVDGRGPVLLILDDLHWADDLTIGWLRFLLDSGRLERTPLVVLATYRTDELDATEDSPLRALVEDPRAGRIQVGRLEPPAIGTMVQDMLGLDSPPPILTQWLARRCDGNPFFVAEYLIAAVEEGLLWRDDSGTWQVADASEKDADESDYEQLGLPSSLRELLERRITGLSEGAMRVLSSVTVLGGESEVELVEAVSGLTEPEFLEVVLELMSRHVLDEPKPGQLQLAHDRLRELAPASVPPEERRRMHRVAAETMSLAASASNDAAAALGWHWEEAGETESARRCYLAAARHAVRRYAHADAERLFRAYMHLSERSSAEVVQARIELGHLVFRVQGRIEEAEAELQRAVQEAVALGDRAAEGRSRRNLGILYFETARIDDARALYTEARTIADEISDALEQGRVRVNLAILHTEQGRLDDAELLYEEALPFVYSTRDRHSEASILSNLGIIAQIRGEVDRAAELFQNAIGLHRWGGRRHEEGIAVGNLAIVHASQGREEDARRCFEQALALHREAGSRRFEGMALANLGILHAHSGRTEEARVGLEHAIAIHREVDNRKDEAIALDNLAQVHASQGRPEAAWPMFQDALQIHRRVGNRLGESVSLLYQSELQRRSGQLDESEATLDLALKLVTELDDPQKIAIAACLRGHLALARGRPARELCQTAHQLSAGLRPGPQSELGQRLGRLDRAVQAHEAGNPLQCGECAEDLPPALQPPRKRSSGLAGAPAHGGHITGTSNTATTKANSVSGTPSFM